MGFALNFFYLILRRPFGHFGTNGRNSQDASEPMKCLEKELNRHLPNTSEQEKDGLFEAFSRSDAFGVIEHSALLDALADHVKGWNLEWIVSSYVTKPVFVDKFH
ncbi:hypothetical protein C1646_761152 [Rhizophagus diaphanus]|nr:hypothetical protein C1646_761152 [Rhizophagus diaphanus] [Rhizophagus sp. MUCL 43196]